MPDSRRDWSQFALLLIDVQGDSWSEEQREVAPHLTVVRNTTELPVIW
jgi:hypothetical protein